MLLAHVKGLGASEHPLLKVYHLAFHPFPKRSVFSSKNYTVLFMGLPLCTIYKISAMPMLKAVMPTHAPNNMFVTSGSCESLDGFL